MLNWQDFAVVFNGKPDLAFSHQQTDAIVRRRKELGGSLFFDRIWTSLQLKQPTKYYPPKTNQDLRNLWQKIAQSTAPEVQKEALLFYLLKDCRDLTGKSEPHPDLTFASKTHLPRKYQTLITGLWELDHCQFSRALDRLTQPSLLSPPTFADEILLVLLKHPKCDNTLAMGYALTVSPPLTNPETLSAYFDVLCASNVVEACHFSRQQTPGDHERLFQSLIHFVLSSGSSDLSAEQRAHQSLTFFSIPYTTEEESWLELYLLQDPVGSKLPGAKDSIIARRIALGKNIEGVSGALDRYHGAKLNGMNWDKVRMSLGSATTDH